MLKLLAALFHAALVLVVVPRSSVATERKTRTPEVQQLRDQLARAKHVLRKVDRGAARALKMGAKTNESVPPAPTVIQGNGGGGGGSGLVGNAAELNGKLTRGSGMYWQRTDGTVIFEPNRPLPRDGRGGIDWERARQQEVEFVQRRGWN